jgi:4-hydroxy-tetrahydrodipicolinate synthase
LCERFAKRNFDVFAGSEVFLLDTLRSGGKGCITATGNINPGPIDQVFRNWQTPQAERLQAAITATRAIVQKQPMISALKAAIAHFAGDAQWKTVRPPLVELSAAQDKQLMSELKASGFSMPGIS